MPSNQFTIQPQIVNTKSQKTINKINIKLKYLINLNKMEL